MANQEFKYKKDKNKNSKLLKPNDRCDLRTEPT